MKFELKTQFRIESARRLTSLLAGHPCANIHGHSFLITLRLHGAQDPKTGWVRDYHEIDETVKTLLRKIDHKLLNEVEGLENPTTENLTAWLFQHLRVPIPELVQVSVSETPTTECSYPVL